MASPDPPIDRTHIFQGEFAKSGNHLRPRGFHSTAIAHPNSRTAGPVLREDPHSHVYEQAVELRRNVDSAWKSKNQPSTFFPPDFSQAKVESTVVRAYHVHQQTQQNPVPVPWRRFADTREESGGTMNVRVEHSPGGLRGFPVL